MEDTIEVDDQLIENTLAEPEWPWIIALAYTVRNVAPEAVATMIWALKHYAQGECAEIATGIALTHLYGLVAGETSKFDWSVIDEIERPIIQAIRRGEIASFGRNEPDSPIRELDQTLWAGGEILMNKKSELKLAGERTLSDFDGTFARQNPTWAYDIHVNANGIRALVQSAFPSPEVTSKPMATGLPGRPRKGRDMLLELHRDRVASRSFAANVMQEARECIALLVKHNESNPGAVYEVPSSAAGVANLLRDSFNANCRSTP